MPKAIATVTDKMFFNGTVVLIHSFLNANPWFNGDIIIIEDNLTKDQEEILKVFPNVKWHNVNKDLKKNIDIVVKSLPNYLKVYRKFYALDVFQIRDYSQILFLDSDILCKGDLSELFAFQESPLVVAPDRSYHLNQKRENETFLAYFDKDQDEHKSYYKCFNSGMMLLNSDLLENQIYSDLLNILIPTTFSNVQTGHSDQYILNRYFHSKENSFQIISSRFNYLLHNQGAIKKEEGVTMSDALLLHYIKRPKPWQVMNNNPSYVLWYKKSQEYRNWLKSKSRRLFNSLNLLDIPLDSQKI